VIEKKVRQKVDSAGTPNREHIRSSTRQRLASRKHTHVCSHQCSLPPDNVLPMQLATRNLFCEARSLARIFVWRIASRDYVRGVQHTGQGLYNKAAFKDLYTDD
jgi:hypothetical protein